MPFETPILAAVPAVFNFAVKGTQTSFELQGVPEQTRALFETIASTRSDIINARERRVALAKQHGPDEFFEWDRSVKDTEAALKDLEKLVESARIDLQHNNGKIGLKTRFTWVLRDSKSLSATSHRLTLAHQRMLFAMTIVHIKHDRERTETSCHHGAGSAPPPYTNQNNVLRRLSDMRRRVDQARLARSNSTGSATEDEVRVRQSPTTRRTVIPALDHEEDFNNLFNHHRSSRTTPLGGSLDSLVATSEVLNRGSAPVLPLFQPLPAQNSSTVPRRLENSGSSRPISGTLRLQAVQADNTRPQQQITVSPQITPPASPLWRPVDAPFLTTCEMGTSADERGAVVPAATLGPPPVLHETASIRFELDAAQEVHARIASEPSQNIPRNLPPVSNAQMTGRMPTAMPAPSSHARRTFMLPYPNDEPPERNPLRLLPQRTTPTTDFTSSATTRSRSGLSSTPHVFAGHRQALNIRWEPEVGDASRDKSTQGPEAPSRPPKISHRDSAGEYTYQPYRPT